jgi:hypothetical protein
VLTGIDVEGTLDNNSRAHNQSRVEPELVRAGSRAAASANGARAITMEATVEELTPLGVAKQPKVLGAWPEGWTGSRAG